ncbi:MAG: NAD(P)-dependent oxidoreductase [Chloroflexota bacterium]|nr:NAD(P)-dependent oxidoreductase [Chloroflexota bacterium]
MTAPAADVPISSRLPSPPARRPRVVLTGATGYIAAQLLPALRRRYDLVLLDVRAVGRDGQPVEGAQVADLLDENWEAHAPHFQGADAVIHLGYYRPPEKSVSGSGKDYLDERPNVDMAEHVYRLALGAGVRRVVVASSNHAADWYEPIIHARKMENLTPEHLPKSDNYYGWAKIAYEALGFTYASGAFGRKLEVVQVRIGAPRELNGATHEGKPQQFKRNLGAYISARDIQQLFARSVETADIADEWGVPFQIFYGISNNTRAFWNIANARRIIGYDPEDDSETRFATDIRRLLIEPGSNGRVGTDA